MFSEVAEIATSENTRFQQLGLKLADTFSATRAISATIPNLAREDPLRLLANNIKGKITDSEFLNA